jgi:uncharacterized integral membrane protein
MRFIQSLLGMVFAVILAVFSVSNMARVSVNYSPVHDPIDLPLYAVALGGVLIGFLGGAFMMWLSAVSKSLAKRKEIKGLKKELKTAKKTSDKGFGEDLDVRDMSAL